MAVGGVKGLSSADENCYKLASNSAMASANFEHGREPIENLKFTNKNGIRKQIEIKDHEKADERRTTRYYLHDRFQKSIVDGQSE